MADLNNEPTDLYIKQHRGNGAPMIVRRITLALLAGGLLVATGCAPTNMADPDAGVTVTTAEPDIDLTETTDTTAAEPAEVGIGQTFTYTDGLAVAVVKVRRAPISEVGAGGNPARHENLVLTVKMTATEATSGELSVSTTLHYGKDGREAEAVFDADGYGGIETDHMQDHPDRLRKGRSLTGVFGFAVPKGGPTEIVFTFTPGYDYEDATFTGLR